MMPARLTRRLELGGLALLAYVPFLLSSPGKVSADTKQYLYLDPGRLLARAAYLWDPHTGTGTVPHQNIGYLFPMGPYYWLMAQLGVPDWVAQRLWLGSITFAAGVGVLWLLRMLGTRRAGALAGALVYMLTPYQLAFTARISVILLPWAALPWLVGLTARALKRGGWRDPALFALIALTAGSISAPSLILVGIAPVIWLVIAVVERQATARDAFRTAVRIAVPTTAVSIWWATALETQGRYGIPVLDVTESLRRVAEAAQPADLLRGFGNWFLSGGDRLGPWLDQSAAYRDDKWLTAVTLAVPVIALVAAAVVRWRHRAFFGALVVVGTIVGVGAWPYDNPSPIGSIFKTFANDSSLGLAFRNTPRVVPIIVLGLAGLIAAGVSALASRRRLELIAAALVAVVVFAGLAPVWADGWLSSRVERPEAIPSYWNQVAQALDRGGDSTRALEVPGILFATYRWGNTVDPITPGLTDRPWVARELLPFGSVASVNLLAALDRRMQQGTLDAAAIAPIARLMRVGTLVLRSDLEYERYGTPRPRVLWALLTAPLAPGLGTPTAFGGSKPNLPAPNVALDEPDVAQADAPWPPHVALFPVHGAPTIVDTASPSRPVVVDGDGDGLVDTAAAGLINGRELVMYAASLDATQLAAALHSGADLVVTDSNRRRARRWDTLRDDVGYTERAGQHALVTDTEDHRLEIAPHVTDADRTVVEQKGARVDATAYGDPNSYIPEDRPALALDGDPRTAWRLSGTEDQVHARLVIHPDHAVHTDHITLTQVRDGTLGRSIARVRLSFDHGPSVDASLDASSLATGGQTIHFSPRTIHSLSIQVLATTGGPATPVGIAEVGLAHVHVDEVTRLPVDLLRDAGTASLQHRLVISLARLRTDVIGADRQDPELAMTRQFDLPTARSFALAGTAQVRSDVVPPSGASTTVCRSDLMTVDGKPVSVKLLPANPASQSQTLEACDGPLQLDAGSHIVRTRPGLDTGIDVNGLVFTSAAGGGAASNAIAGLGSQPQASGARARVVDSGTTSFDLSVHTNGKPFWLVLGQSLNDGWHAELADGTSLGAPRLVDGFANGWLVTPKHAGTVTIRLRWTPQRLIWIGLAISALATLVCALVVWRTRRRAAATTLSETPVLGTPLAFDGAAPSWRTALVLAAATGVVAGAVSRPWMGLAVGVATLVALRVGRGRFLLVAGAPLVLAVAKVAVKPELGWLAVLLFAADVACGLLYARPQADAALASNPSSSKRSAADGTPQPGS